ncbi:MAG: hypothetical protein Q7S16_04130 [bacterium]|nr:hypothetical protein [bacterium]
MKDGLLEGEEVGCGGLLVLLQLADFFGKRVEMDEKIYCYSTIL